MLFWCRAVGAERGLDAEVTQPDVFPLAVQGPRAADVMAALFGDWARDLPRFRFRPAAVDGIEVASGPLRLVRAGGASRSTCAAARRGSDLWRLVAEAGRPCGIGPGAPQLHRAHGERPAVL